MQLHIVKYKEALNHQASSTTLWVTSLAVSTAPCLDHLLNHLCPGKLTNSSPTMEFFRGRPLVFGGVRNRITENFEKSARIWENTTTKEKAHYLSVILQKKNRRLNQNSCSTIYPQSLLFTIPPPNIRLYIYNSCFPKSPTTLLLKVPAPKNCFFATFLKGGTFSFLKKQTSKWRQVEGNQWCGCQDPSTYKVLSWVDSLIGLSSKWFTKINRWGFEELVFNKMCVRPWFSWFLWKK